MARRAAVPTRNHVSEIHRQHVKLASSSTDLTWTQLVEERVRYLEHDSFEGNLAHFVSPLHSDVPCEAWISKRRGKQISWIIGKSVPLRRRHV